MAGVIHTIQFRSGETTCASKPGVFCRFFYTKSFGTKYVCHLFDDTPLFNHSYGDKSGWAARCPACLSEFPNEPATN